MAIHTPRACARQFIEDSLTEIRSVGRAAELEVVLERLITARDAAIRAEERARCAQIADGCYSGETAAYHIRARAQPVPAPEHGEGGAERATPCTHGGMGGTYRPDGRLFCNNCGGEILLQPVPAERAKETGDE